MMESHLTEFASTYSRASIGRDFIHLPRQVEVVECSAGSWTGINTDAFLNLAEGYNVSLCKSNLKLPEKKSPEQVSLLARKFRQSSASHLKTIGFEMLARVDDETAKYTQREIRKGDSGGLCTKGR
nr:hypothetical protein CFP56_72641 [Quercus suber]